MPDKDTKKDNIHKGHRERVRKRFLKDGINAFEDHQILEFLLFYVHKIKDTNPIGHALINKFKSLDGVFSASYEELCSVDGISESGASLIMLIGQLRNRISRDTMEKKVRFSTHRDAAEYCMKLFDGLSVEKLFLISLNSMKDVISTDVISEGTCNATTADMRKILEIAMLRKASGVIITHNHPGDSPHPSSSDVAVTTKIINLLESINISVIDHIICSGSDYSSMSERGILETL